MYKSFIFSTTKKYMFKLSKTDAKLVLSSILHHTRNTEFSWEFHTIVEGEYIYG